MYEMVKKIIGRSCGSSGSPALLPAGLSPHCCALLSSSCCPGPLQGMGTEFGALPLRWHLPRPGQPDPSSEQVSWLGTQEGWEQQDGIQHSSKMHPWSCSAGGGCSLWVGKGLDTAQAGPAPGAGQWDSPGAGTWCSARGVLSLLCPAVPGFALLGHGASGVLCFICWLAGAVPFPSHPAWLCRQC